jgi:hypothetical protein
MTQNVGEKRWAAHRGLAHLACGWGAVIMLGCGGNVDDATANADRGGGGEASASEGVDDLPVSSNVGGAGGLDAEMGAGGDIVRLDPAGGAPNTQPVETIPAAEVGRCSLTQIATTASENSPSDGCGATYACEAGAEVLIVCDGENDGTNTSLCSCATGSKTVDSGGVIDGEAPESCNNALLPCLRALGYSMPAP